MLGRDPIRRKRPGRWLRFWRCHRTVAVALDRVQPCGPLSQGRPLRAELTLDSRGHSGSHLIAGISGRQPPGVGRPGVDSSTPRISGPSEDGVESALPLNNFL